MPSIPEITSEQMREIDRLMTTELGISLLQMMENAGRSLAEIARRSVPQLVGMPVTVLAGPGGNGGGALAAARRLAVWGARVSIALGVEAHELHDAAAAQLTTLARMGIAPLPSTEWAGSVSTSAIVLDGLLGYGGTGRPRGSIAELIGLANSSGVPIVALDLPSGLSADTGEAGDPTIRAHRT